MTFVVRARAITLIVVFTAFGESSATTAAASTAEWLRGFGKDLEFCVKGEVVDADGAPATGIELSGGVHGDGVKQPLSPTLDGHRFTLWLKVNQFSWDAVWLRAASAEDDRAACVVLKPFELRQVAIDGVKLKLQLPARKVKVKVTDRGRPVDGATVKALLWNGIELQAATGDDGIATINLLPKQELRNLIALTDDHRTGGYRFNASLPHNPEADEHEIKLAKCRNLKLRFVREDGSPAQSLRFQVRYNMPKPEHANQVPIADATILSSDAAGEAVFPWLPLGNNIPYYVELAEAYWTLDYNAKIDGDYFVYTIKNRRPRKQVAGRVIVSGDVPAPAGFFVRLQSPQGEYQYYSDRIHVFADADGSFSVAVLPNSKYGCHVFDSRWAGEFRDLVPYDSVSKKLTPIELHVSKGQPVTVVATAGPNRKPIANAEIEFRRSYEFAWQEGDQQRWEQIMLQWPAKTDAGGVAITHTLPGPLGAQLRAPNWADYKTITVMADKPATIKFHHELKEKQTVTGRLVLTEGATADLKDAEIQLGLGPGPGNRPIKCNADGSFQFETSLSGVMAIARTADGKAYGTIVATKIDTPLEIKLVPTQDFDGQLLGKDDQPVVGNEVTATIKLEVPHHGGSPKLLTLEIPHFRAKTDRQGNFTLRGLPTQREICLYCVSIDRKHTVGLDRVELESKESPPRKVYRLESFAEPPKETPLADRVQSALRDCKRTGRRLMVILHHEDDAVKDFVEANYFDAKKHKQREGFVSIVVPFNWNRIKSADVRFYADRGWDFPSLGGADTFVLDANGKLLGRHSTNVMLREPTEGISEFIRQHAPQPQNVNVESDSSNSK